MSTEVDQMERLVRGCIADRLELISRVYAEHPAALHSGLEVATALQVRADVTRGGERS